MNQDQSIAIPSLPSPLRWQGVPQNWSLDSDSNLSLTAGQKTDWFLDPGGSVNVLNAPALLATVQQPCMLRALVTSDASATFDAAVLTVYQADDQWAKLCFELSPQGQLMIVSVVTKGTSDDCNSVPISGRSVYLRLSVLEKAYAFHYSLSGSTWNLVRYFTLGERKNVEIGFLSQSPTGEGCTASFSEIAFLSQNLSDIRLGI
jgi:regulation of enolase protein 1 (concanavalin A-like superfamily)